jgi:prephenate dehydrogenase
VSPPFATASIVGLGLMGGSLAHDLAARGVRVRGYDIDERHLEDAICAGVVREPLSDDFTDIAADLVVIGVPVDAALEVLVRAAPFVGDARLVTDLGSTKTRIVQAARELGLASRFVGSHPMAGDHRSGWRAARPGLFADARVYLCPVSEEAMEATALASLLWTQLGAAPEVIAPDEHDRRLAWASHLPHVVAASLGLAMANVGVSRGELGPGGRDATRLAGSAPELWTAIALDNAGELELALASAEREIASFRRALTQADAGELRRRFAAARRWFDE